MFKEKAIMVLVFLFFLFQSCTADPTHRVAIWKAMGFGVKSIEFWGEKH